MKNLNFVFLFITFSLSLNFCMGHTDYEKALEIAHDTTNKFPKHIFFVDSIRYECGNHNGKIFNTTYVLLGKGKSSIPNEKAADRVNISFVSEKKSEKSYYDKNTKTIYIFYPKNQYDYIQNLLLYSEKIWAQFFYFGNNNEKTYGDIHGRLLHNLE